LKSQAKSFVPFGKKEIKEAANDGAATAHPTGSTDPNDHAELLKSDAQQGNASGGLDAVGGVKAAANSLQNKASVDNDAPDKAKSKAKEYNARTQDYLKTKMPKERREQTLWRLKKMVVEIQGHADCKFVMQSTVHHFNKVQISKR